MRARLHNRPAYSQWAITLIRFTDLQILGKGEEVKTWTSQKTRGKRDTMRTVVCLEVWEGTNRIRRKVSTVLNTISDICLNPGTMPEVFDLCFLNDIIGQHHSVNDALISTIFRVSLKVWL